MPVLEQVLERYREEVKLVFKNFPLRSHTNSRAASAAAAAADRQGKFWEFHDLLFKNHKQLSPQTINRISEELGLDKEQFRRDMTDPGTLATISRDISQGNQASVRGTPTVFINGKLLRNPTFEGFQDGVEKELQKSRRKTS